jgi:hypothetical protein
MLMLALLAAALAAWLYCQGINTWTMGGVDDVGLKVCETVEPFVLSPSPVCQAALLKLANETETLRRHREAVGEGYARVLQESSQWLEIARDLQNGRKPALLDRTEATDGGPASDITPPTRDADFRSQYDARIETLEKELAELDAQASILFTRGVDALELQASVSDLQSDNISTTPSQLPSATQLEAWASAAGACPHGSEEQLLCEQALRPARAEMEALMRLRSADLLGELA